MMLSSPDVFFRYVHPDAVQLGFVYPEATGLPISVACAVQPVQVGLHFQIRLYRTARPFSHLSRLAESTILANRPAGSFRMLHDV